MRKTSPPKSLPTPPTRSSGSSPARRRCSRGSTPWRAAGSPTRPDDGRARVQSSTPSSIQRERRDRRRADRQVDAAGAQRRVLVRRGAPGSAHAAPHGRRAAHGGRRDSAGGESNLGQFESGPGFTPELEPALAGFVTRYRDSLKDGTASPVGTATAGGRKVTLLWFDVSRTERQVVAVDAETYKPLSFQSMYRGGRRGPEWRVVTIESVPRDPQFFAPPERSAPRPTSGMVHEAEPVTLQAAERELEAVPVWLGERFADQPVAVSRSRTQSTFTDAEGRGDRRPARVRPGSRRDCVCAGRRLRDRNGRRGRPAATGRLDRDHARVRPKRQLGGRAPQPRAVRLAGRAVPRAAARGRARCVRCAKPALSPG